ncbi:antitoxin [Candidatus Electronema sp. TJ]|uniref:antitoxin n=1 Tax=Candidatus Electronema sp. TJ TaxID=3401573 RepID=UPI003AA86A67
MNVNNEQELIDSVENEEWNSVSDLDSFKKRLMQAAAETSARDCQINVMVSKRDAEALKAKALEEGVPWQTLVTSILHKYVTGRIVERQGC